MSQSTENNITTQENNPPSTDSNPPTQENNNLSTGSNPPTQENGNQSNDNNVAATDNSNQTTESNAINTDSNKTKMKEKIWYSLDFGFLLSGIIIFLLCDYQGNSTENRSIISGIFIAISYFMFPLVEYKKKEKALCHIGIHLLLSFACLVLLYKSLSFYKDHLTGGETGSEILAALAILVPISYVGYVFISVLKVVIIIVKKIKNYLFSNSAQSGYSAAKKIIEGITAFIVAATAMIASVTALIAAAKAFIPK